MSIFVHTQCLVSVIKAMVRSNKVQKKIIFCYYLVII